VITKTVNFVRLRWLMIVLFSSLWATMGGAVSLAERGDFTGSAEALHSREERLDRASAEVADAFEAAFYKTVSDPDCLEQFLRKAAAEAVFAAATMGLSELRLLKGVGALDDVIAASKGVKAAKSGEPSATKAGRQAHKDWQPGEGFEKEVTLPSGKRADAVNLETKQVKELKPDNARAVKRGEKQVEGYRQEFEKEHGGDWTGSVETYKR
jgi:hypothetical protein